ncbi:tRNA (adenosine(37)-N6)-threonylcarbamoyltransferase complex ATPase subunit type 1 TsaE [Thiomicrorhabdus sp. zzn3]|uniref:tRNA (adenosine(37)-N6)-threonylcarbamoyltransferase complex ATPase subunit type 1 TsaE n=1 Tax=Thiomicrorhabdus sp. zzn3 TaxID=3039775 RepID=UPI0024373EB3|nr:tRNA (adenosine(37)-N6)-threonylcarbamoyltransferase complex ATPase subunit type 1 TsaE [Thiomicrorhabdus sp. zzn3]MDG6777749.1 tRNA (adenosine(37)-N6)-threonylcarbamoyltransferase complex ATPase subunit type 1 TsaE [Thiomicrorhabdus sp. zzn3]
MTNSKTVCEKRELFLSDEAETAAFAQQLARACEALESYQNGLMIYLKGDLGAGKSFLSRVFIQHFLPGQKVKSPTYTIVESYKYYKFSIHHLDLYRLCDPEELEYLAVRDLLSGNYVALVEWPQKAEGVLPNADLELNLSHETPGRRLLMRAYSEAGKALLEALTEQ